MASTQDYSSLFKDQYGSGPIDLLPKADKFQKLVPFVKSAVVGGQFIENVDLEFEHGFTLGGNQVAPTLVGSIAGENEQAKITPSQIIGQKSVGYRDIVRTDGGGKRSFSPVAHKRILDVTKGMRRNIEISIMHGQSVDGIGVVASLSSQTITLQAAKTAPGIWAGSRNMVIDVMQGASTTPRQSGLTVSAVDFTNPDAVTLTLVGTVTGITNGDVIYRKNAFASAAWQECFGVKAVLQATGTYFNINPATHVLWQPNTYSVNGRLTFRDILAAVDLGVTKGLDSDVLAVIPTRAYSRLVDDVNSMIIKDSSYDPKKATVGVEGVEVHGQTGKITIVPHIYMMQGEFWVLPYETDSKVDPADRPMKRIGSTDITFGMPGAQGGTGTDDIFVQSATTAAVEVRNYTDQCLFINKPGWCTIGTGITYP